MTFGRQFGAAFAAAVMVAASLVGAFYPQEADAVPTGAQPVSEAYELRMAAVRASIAERTAPAPKVADPFAQLARIGLDGEGLRETVTRAGLALGPLERFDLSRIDVAAIDKDARRCLTHAIYYEARDQSLTGRLAVADVVMNRVESRRYPDSVCGVVYQGSSRETGCQFSFTCDGSIGRPMERRAMIEAQTLATAVLGGWRLPLTGGATHYHADYVSPYWAPSLRRTAVIGDHLFYRRGTAKPVRLAMAE